MPGFDKAGTSHHPARERKTKQQSDNCSLAQWLCLCLWWSFLKARLPIHLQISFGAVKSETILTLFMSNNLMGWVFVPNIVSSPPTKQRKRQLKISLSSLTMEELDGVSPPMKLGEVFHFGQQILERALFFSFKTLCWYTHQIKKLPCGMQDA